MMNLPDRLELNGADCFHLLLEKLNQSNPESNNVVRMYVVLKSPEEVNRLQEEIEGSDIIQWIARLRLERKSLKHPAWLHDPSMKGLQVITHDNPADFEDVKNTPIHIGRDQLVRFDTLVTDSQFKLLFSWHHIILDGRGAGMLMSLLANVEKNKSLKNTTVFKHPVENKSFKKRFVRMFDVKHFVEDMLKNSLEAPEISHPNEVGFHHQVVSLDKEQTKTIEQNADQAGCRFGINMFQLACCFLTYSKITSTKKKLWVPVPYDGRKRGSKGPIIGNHISFLFYQIDPVVYPNPKSVVASLNSQMNDQLKRDIPSKYNDMLSLMRKFPLWFNKWATTRSAKGRVSSFLYSSSGQGHWDTNRMNDSFDDVILIPPFSNDPGLTFTFSRFDDAIKLNIVACKRKFDDKQLSLIQDTMLEYLLGSKNWKN